MNGAAAGRRVRLKDSTLREGADTPGVRFSEADKLAVLRLLAEAGVPEAEIVAPGHFRRDLPFCARVRREGLPIETSGLVYAGGAQAREQTEAAAAHLDRLELLIPLSERRPPHGREDKLRRIGEALAWARGCRAQVGVGFPHATQADRAFLLEACDASAREGARRVIVYDTNGSADPFQVYETVRAVKERVPIEVSFHGHNDLGLATANSLAAALAGAECLEVTVNGLGDRAGNASLEQVALALRRRGLAHGVDLSRLPALCGAVAAMSGIPVPGLAPVVGAFAFVHKSPSHLDTPDLFEAFDPGLVGARRRVAAD